MYLSVSSVRVTVRGCSMVQSLDGCTGMYYVVRLTVKYTSRVVKETVEIQVGAVTQITSIHLVQSRVT